MFVQKLHRFGIENVLFFRQDLQDYLDSFVAFSPSACVPSAALQALAGGSRAAQARPPAKRSEADGRGGRAWSLANLGMGRLLAFPFIAQVK